MCSRVTPRTTAAFRSVSQGRTPYDCPECPPKLRTPAWVRRFAWRRRGRRRSCLAGTCSSTIRRALLVFAVDLPVSSQVIRASRKDPYLGFTLELDPVRVAELARRVYPRGILKAPDSRGLYVGRSTDAIVDPVIRLLELMVSWSRSCCRSPAPRARIKRSCSARLSAPEDRLRARSTERRRGASAGHRLRHAHARAR